MLTTIAVSNQKGGVAKTTSCLSLGACLAELGYSVLLIDLDPQSHLTLSMGLKPDKLRRTVRDALLGNVSLVSASRESPVFDLDIVPANQGLALINKLFYEQKGFEFHLKNRLRALTDNLYQVIIIDCPPSFDTLTLNALTAADLLIIPVQCEYYAANSLRQIIRLARLVQQKTNPQLTYQILVTMYDRRNRVCKLVFDQLQTNLSQNLFDTIIEVDTKLRESPAFGKPITLYAPNTRGARQYRALAKELMNYG
ncbi:MAG: ParA family protein [Anaerolineae bacterium]